MSLMYVTSGDIRLTEQLYRETQKMEAAYSELQWIALHHDEATDTQRAWLARVMTAIDKIED
jgi:hypothetical protein